MHKCLSSLALCSLAASPIAAPAWSQEIPEAASVQLEPAGQWQVEYDEWRCLLQRNFTAGGKRSLFSLALEPITSTAWLKIAIEGDPASGDGDDAVMLADGKRRPKTLHYNFFPASGFRVREFMLDLNQHDLGAVQEKIRFWTRKNGDIEVRAVGFQPAWKALQKCMSSLYADLGVDEAALGQVATKPGGDILAFATFPRGRPLDAALLFWVTAKGTVDECRLLKPSGIESFDTSVCSELKAKARYKPARNAAGDPIRAPVYEYLRIRTTTVSTVNPRGSR